MNRNAFIGRNVEVLFKNSVSDHPVVIEKIREYFKIQGRFLNAISTGIHAEKSDVKLEFADGHNIDANVKTFKVHGPAYNQITRTSIANFCKKFSLEAEQKELQELFIAKAKHVSIHVFPDVVRTKWLAIFERIASDILKWSFSYKSSREILVLCERDCMTTMYLYSMKDVIQNLNRKISFTRSGNVAIGTSVVFQRKGGNGVHSKNITRDNLKHPGNNVQIKLKMREFIREMAGVLLTSYHV